MAAFPSPTSGASLILSFRLHHKTVVVVGSNPLAASRAFSALEANSSVVIIAKGGLEGACQELKWRAEQNQLTILDFESLPGPSLQTNIDQDAGALEAYLSTISSISFVVVTDTLMNGDHRRSFASAANLAQICRSRNIPINVTDYPDLCDFSFTSTHRFLDPNDNTSTSLQIGITTNGQGCRLAGRLRREIVTKLPRDVGGAVARVGKLRTLAKASKTTIPETDAELNEEGSTPTPNQPVAQRSSDETAEESARRRMKWVAQVSEYWPISRLAKMTENEMADILDGQGGLSSVSVHGERPSASLHHHPGDSEVNSLHELSLSPTIPLGRILLVGSGPGHPSLLTLATHAALTKHADLVLSDKLVPAAVLALIPADVEVQIARKFPGNADGAQNELMEAAVEAARRGLTVVRVSLYYSIAGDNIYIIAIIVETRRSNCLRKSRRRSAVLPRARLRTCRNSRCELSACRADIRRNTCNTTRCSRVFHRMHRGRQTRQGGQATRLRAQSHGCRPYGRSSPTSGT